jgi:hypothetical protein
LNRKDRRSEGFEQKTFRSHDLTVRSLVWVAVLCSLTGCQRGWLASELRTLGVGAPPQEKDWLGVVDCPAGLSRCVGGVVQTSLSARRPRDCKESGEGRAACQCPWSAVSRCPGPCAADGIELAVDGDASTQLCPAEDVAQFAQRALCNSAQGSLSSDPPDCEGESYVCSSSRVVACADRRVLGTCSIACAELSVDAHVALSDDTVLSLLCAHQR